MSPTVRWVDPHKRVILVTYDEHFEWSLLDEVEATLTNMLDEVDHPVDALVDATQVRPPQSFLFRFPKMASETPFLHHPHVGVTVLCTTNPALKWMLQQFNNLFAPPGKRFYHAPSVQAGKELLAGLHAERDS